MSSQRPSRGQARRSLLRVAWSLAAADNSRLASRVGADYAGTVRVASGDDENLTQAGALPGTLTRHPAADFSPAWSPDASEIAFHSFRKGNRDVYVMLADGTRVQEVVATPAQEQVARWSADGTTLSYHGGDGGYVVSRRGGPGSDWGQPRRLETPRGTLSHPSWSPVADSLAWGTSDGIAVRSPDGGPPRIVARTSGRSGPALEVDWSRDGQTLYYVARDSSGTWEIWSVPVSGGVARRLVHFADPARQLYRPRLVNDGENFYFVIGSRESDIWVMDLAKR